MAKASDIEGLDCSAPASAGIALILRTRLAEMCALRAAALDWTDVEGVHDMRVASRRLRSALRDFAPFLRKSLPRRSLRRLAAALGAVRDDDVALIALAALAHEADADVTAGLSLLVAARQERRAKARSELIRALDETALDALQAKFTRKLERAVAAATPSDERNSDSQPELSFEQAGREIIAKLLTELYGGGHALYRPHSEWRIHQLRIIAKRLRYALELFAQCWGEPLTACADEIAGLQKSLGELHDCDVWIAELSELLRRSDSEREHAATEGDAARAAAHQAAVCLLGRFVKERAKHFRTALDGWETLRAADFRTHLLTTILQASDATNTSPTTAATQPTEAQA